ncbi:unnamed protein product [Urochloa humidicola]
MSHMTQPPQRLSRHKRCSSEAYTTDTTFSGNNESVPHIQQQQLYRPQQRDHFCPIVPTRIATENRAKRRRINQYKALARQVLSSAESRFPSRKEYISFLKAIFWYQKHVIYLRWRSDTGKREVG